MCVAVSCHPTFRVGEEVHPFSSVGEMGEFVKGGGIISSRPVLGKIQMETEDLAIHSLKNVLSASLRKSSVLWLETTA